MIFGLNIEFKGEMILNILGEKGRYFKKDGDCYYEIFLNFFFGGSILNVSVLKEKFRMRLWIFFF